MSKGASTGIIIAIVAIAVIVIMMQQPKKAVGGSSTSAGQGYLNGLFQLGSALVSSNSNKPQPGGSGLNTVPQGFDTNNFSTQNGFEYTDVNGNFVAG